MKPLICPHCKEVLSDDFVQDANALLRKECLYPTEYYYTCHECNKEFLINIEGFTFDESGEDYCEEGKPFTDLEFNVGIENE